MNRKPLAMRGYISSGFYSYVNSFTAKEQVYATDPVTELAMKWRLVMKWWLQPSRDWNTLSGSGEYGRKTVVICSMLQEMKILQSFEWMELTNDDFSQCTLICHQDQKIGSSTYVSNSEMHLHSATQLGTSVLFQTQDHLGRNVLYIEDEMTTKNQQINHILLEFYQVETMPEYTISLHHVRKM